MDTSDYLYAMAEVSVAFVGFSAIVASLRQRSRPLSETEALYLAMLVERSLATLGFSMLLPLLRYLGFNEIEASRGLSVLLGVYLLLIAYRSIRLHRFRLLTIPLTTFWVRVAVTSMMAIAMFMNAAGLGDVHSPGWYLLGVSLLLVAATLAFTALLRIQPDLHLPVEESSAGVDAFGHPLDEAKRES